MTVHTPKTVVVGCDGSWDSRRAVTAATYEAVRRDAELVVLSLPSSPERRSDRLGDVSRAEQDELATAFAMASRGLALAREVDPSIRGRSLVLSQEAPELAQVLSGAQLLVLGAHGRSGQRVFSLGSTSHRLAHGAVAPVLLVAPDGPATASTGRPKVVVGLNPRPGAVHALAYAVAQAGLRQAALVVVRAVLPNQPHVADAVVRANQECAAALHEVAGDRDGVEVSVVVAPVAEALLAACAPSDLLVLGNRGSGRLNGPVPGSLTQRLVDAAVCDVILVPVPDERTQDVAAASVAEPA